MKKRLNNLSIYRLVATICILQFHIFYILYSRAIPYEMLLSKGVQGLTALSGFLYSQKVIKDYKSFMLNNTKKIIIPALMCLLVMAVWDLVVMLITRNWNYIGLFCDRRAYNNGFLIQPGNYYYIIYIILCYMVTPVLQRCDKWSNLVVMGTLAIELTIGFFAGSAIIACSYIAGYYIGKKFFKQYTDNEEKYSLKHLFAWIGILAVSTTVYVLLVIYSFGDLYVLVQLQKLISNIAATTFGVATFFLMAHALRATNRLSTIKPLVFTDKLSLIIYLFNQAFMCGGMKISDWVEPMWAKTILIYVFTIAFSVLVHFLSTWVLKLIDNRKKKETPVMA